MFKTKKAPDMPGPCSVTGNYSSVPRNQRSAPLVAQADDGRLNVPGFCIESVRASRDTGELIALPLESRIVIFKSDDPVLGNAVFPTGADGPAVVPLGLRARARRRNQIDNRQAVVHAGITALHVE